MSIILDDFDVLLAWLEEQLGVSVSCADADPIPVLVSEPRETGARSVWATRLGERGLVTTCRRWADSLQSVVESMSSDELFSSFGTYELARITLPDGVGIWGPSWYFVGDERCFNTDEDSRPVHLAPDELRASFDSETFWHCFLDKAVVGFGILEEGKAAALATVRPESEGIWIVGVDVVPEVAGSGLGRAVASAACRWIIERGGLILVKTAPWNVPSARLFRSLGLKYVLSDLVGVPGPFRVPPQSLGQPRPDAKLYNYYPAWAMNGQILPKA